MNFDALTVTYLTKQLVRIEKVRGKISATALNATAGRVIPEDGDLAIGTGRHINAAVMYLDISSFSDRPSGSEVEQSNNLRVLTLFFSEMVRVIEDHGGVVEKNTGDGLMAYFPESPTGESVKASQKAVACALTMFTITENYINGIIAQSHLPTIDFRVCIDYGLITVAQVGSPGRFNGIVAIGSPANLASKMLKIAKADELLLGEKAIAGLPALWVSNFAEVHPEQSGWHYIQTSQPYRLYRYKGRWKIPQL